LRAGTWIDPKGSRTQFSEWVEIWKTTTLNLRASTRVRDFDYLDRYIIPVFGTDALGEISHLDVQAWVSDLTLRGLAPATVMKAGQILNRVMASAVRTGLLVASPCKGVTFPQIQQKEMRFLTPAEVARLADSIAPPYRAVVLLGAYGGLRVGEIFGLRRSCIDLERCTIDVVETLTEAAGRLYEGPPKTRAGRRVVPIPNVVAEALADHLAEMSDNPSVRVFIAPQGGPVRLASWRQRFWNPAVRAAELWPLRPHDLRHTAVALWIAAGASPREIATRAGHASVSFSLDRYGHLFPGSENRVNDALDEFARNATDVAHGAPESSTQAPEKSETPTLTLINGVGAGGLEPSTSAV
jgi:integrase